MKKKKEERNKLLDALLGTRAEDSETMRGRKHRAEARDNSQESENSPTKGKEKDAANRNILC